MTDLTFSIVAVFAFAFAFLGFWVEYRLSGCMYGGAYNGKDNWLLRTIKTAIAKKKARKKSYARDISDI